jgi:hypothetical protein
MDSELLAGLSKNDSGTGKQIDASLTPSGSLDVLPGFKALGRELSRRRPHLPEEAQGHASNLIEQIDNIHDEADLKRLKPFIACTLPKARPARQELFRLEWRAAPAPGRCGRRHQGVSIKRTQ